MPARDRDPMVIAIDDNQDHAALLTKALKKGTKTQQIAIDPNVLTFSDPIEAIAALPVERLVVILIDYHLADSNALDWLNEFIKRDVGPVLILTSQGNQRIATEALKNGAADFLIKNQVIENHELLYQSIGQAVRRYKLESRNRVLARELKVSNHALEIKNERLSEMTDTAHRFVDDVAHEFRTPLAVIQEFASIITDGIGGPVTEQQTEFLGYISSATRDLAQMVDDLLDSSRLKHRALRVTREAHSVKELFDHIRPTVAAHAQNKKITIREQIDNGLPEVFCDLEKAGRALINLAINAVKFSPDGSTVELVAEAGENDKVRIRVTDHGPGLAEEDLGRICQRFSQAKNGESGKVKGFGLGLNIASELIHLNLGRMDVTSKPGEGSTFAFTLPGCNPHRILEQYLGLVTEDDPAVSITVLHAALSTPGDDMDALRRLLASTCYPMDLIINTKQGHEILLIGSTTEPSGWMDRIQSAWQDAHQNSDEPTPLTTRWLGTWSPPELEHALTQCVMDHILETRACA